MTTAAAALQTVRIAHSPDSDDAFMFYALTGGLLDVEGLEVTHELHDIETLNRAAFEGRYEISALSIHAYAHLADRYRLMPSGASFGDGYGPVVVAREALSAGDLDGRPVAIPGELTTAALALGLWARQQGIELATEVVPFDRILDVVASGEHAAGVVIHEGQLTYGDQGLAAVVDLGAWWKGDTGLPLPLGGNGIRRDLGKDRIKRISRHLHDSIKWGLDHRDEALSYALKYARDMGKDKADKFVGMYVNDYTLDYGEKGRAAVRRFLDEGRRLGLITVPVAPEWSE